MKVKLLPSAEDYVPFVADAGSAGIDLIVTEDLVLEPGYPLTVGTGVCVEIPKGFFGMVVHRSSMAFKLDVICSLGVVDSSFRGEIKVRYFNLGDEPVFIKAGSRAAQLVIIPCMPLHSNITIVDELSDSDRGENGFGSSGV